MSNEENKLPFHVPEHIDQLWIIEAPGKRNVLSESLKEIEEEKSNGKNEKLVTFVFATKGYLMSMPDSMVSSGINKEFKDFSRKPHNIGIYNNLLEIAKKSYSIIVATDADREGDVIAFDIYNALLDINNRIIRVRLQAMDKISVLNAIRLAKPVDKNDAISGRTRALIDRLIGAAFLRGDNIGVGRVSAGLIGIVRNGGLSKGTLTLTANDSDGGHPWCCELEIRNPLTLELAKKLSSETFPNLIKDIELPYHFEPDNAGEVMLKANKIMGLSPSKTAEAMQRNYESGWMSYPRSHSKGFSETVAKRLKDNFNDVKGVTAEAIPAMKTTETHEALHAIGPINMGAKPERMGADEGVRTIVGRNVIKCLQTHIREYADTKPIKEYMEKENYRKDIVELVIKSKWYRDNGPSYPGKVTYKKQGINKHSVEYMLLDACIHYGLGRSSSWPSLIDGIVEKELVDKNGQLTVAGEEFSQKIPKELLDYKLSVKIDNICENANKILDKIPVPPGKEPWEHLAKEVVERLPGGLSDKISSTMENESHISHESSLE